MFKILILQSLYNLSDDQTEYQTLARLFFMRFFWLDLDQRIHDARTIWLFRETLTQTEVMANLFNQFEAHLDTHLLQPRRGQLIDAALVPVPKQREFRKENATIKTGTVRLNRTGSATHGGRKTLRPAGLRNIRLVTL